MTLFIHELKQNSKTLLIWTAVIAGMTFVFMLIFPQMAEQAAEINDLYANMGGFSAAFGMDRLKFTTPMGFYGVEAGAVIAVGGGMLAALLGGNILCKEEGGHTVEFLLTAPIRRSNAAAQKLAAVLTMVLVFNLVCVLSGTAAFVIIGEEPEWSNFLLYHTAQLIMQWEIACICFGISAFLKKVSMGLAIGVSLLFYFLQMFINVSDGMDWLKYVTPYYYSDAANIFPEGAVQWGFVLLGAGYGAAAAVIALLKYNRKDIAA